MTIDARQRARLLERRRLLALRRARAATVATFRDVAPLLCDAGLRFAKSTPAANRRSLGRLTEGPGQDGELDFGWIENAAVDHWTTAAEEARLVRAALAACAGPDTRVTVVWHPAEAGLRIAAGDLARHVETILAAATEAVWIVAAAPGDWIIQAGRWTEAVAYCPDLPAHGPGEGQAGPGARGT